MRYTMHQIWCEEVNVTYQLFEFLWILCNQYS